MRLVDALDERVSAAGASEASGRARSRKRKRRPEGPPSEAMVRSRGLR